MAERTYTPAEIAAKADRALLRVAQLLADLSQMSDEDFRAVDAQLAGNAVETVQEWVINYLMKRSRADYNARWGGTVEAEEDEGVRALVSRQWAADWDSEDDAAYDA